MVWTIVSIVKRNSYSVLAIEKNCKKTATWQRMQNLFIYCCTVPDSVFQCVFTVYSVVLFLYFSLLVIFIYCKITL